MPLHLDNPVTEEDRLLANDEKNRAVLEAKRNLMPWFLGDIGFGLLAMRIKTLL